MVDLPSENVSAFTLTLKVLRYFIELKWILNIEGHFRWLPARQSYIVGTTFILSWWIQANFFIFVKSLRLSLQIDLWVLIFWYLKRKNGRNATYAKVYSDWNTEGILLSFCQLQSISCCSILTFKESIFHLRFLKFIPYYLLRKQPHGALQGFF